MLHVIGTALAVAATPNINDATQKIISTFFILLPSLPQD
jgi:hypothetical protein